MSKMFASCSLIILLASRGKISNIYQTNLFSREHLLLQYLNLGLSLNRQKYIWASELHLLAFYLLVQIIYLILLVKITFTSFFTFQYPVNFSVVKFSFQSVFKVTPELYGCLIRILDVTHPYYLICRLSILNILTIKLIVALLH